ncbi:sensor domain-containing diguanylate cyclase [Butyrivibrio sp. MB2005]|uniref:sensor domain-containing diguanylate cyclase n=1 Tax=Butyrivibrio sp. MB2005 TaxID=1280678 RepID=UPI0004152440|nr:sensor domain-containing diguanylate cyclase [Butyrivibrio sp. MB2005]
MDRYTFDEKTQTAYERLQNSIAIFQFLDDGIVPIVISDGYCEMFGFKNQEEAYADLNKDIFINVHPEDAAKILEESKLAAKTNGKYEILYRASVNNKPGHKFIRAAGKYVYLENDVTLIHVCYMDEGAEASQKITDLQDSVTWLLNNMPAMSFSKDINTGKYLACNQAFANYAHKETPAGVVGLTDFEIFDSDTASHFVEDDQKAFKMDKPYIFYEDVPDAAGNQRRFQTTKLKFIDETGRECLLGLCQDVTDAMIIKQEYAEKLAKEHTNANIDALTGIKNRSAYLEVEKGMNLLISDHKQNDFAITIFDVNDLKKVNDTLGHKAGDEYICSACKIICDIFKHSPVFRIGGDEFVAISDNDDYEHIDELIDIFEERNFNSQQSGDIVIACGMEKFDKGNDENVVSVFNRADDKMYAQKKKLKGEQ